MLTLVLSVIGIVVTLLLIIGIHECGHFLAARFLGIKVLRFSIGFGKAIWSRRDKKGTEYVIASIPLGGYVKMLDENEEEVSAKEKPLAFNNQPFYKKFIVVIAGPLSNLLLAFFLYWLLFIIGFKSIAPVIGAVTPHSIADTAGIKPGTEIISIDHTPTRGWMSVVVRLLSRIGDKGNIEIALKSITNQTVQNYKMNIIDWRVDKLKPDPLASLGIQPYEPEIKPIIGEIAVQSPAEKAGLKLGDRIKMFDQKKINDWLTLATNIENNPGQKVTLLIERQNKNLIIPITIGNGRNFLYQKHGFLGISPHYIIPKNLIRNNQYGPFTALYYAWQNTYDFIYLNIDVIIKLFTGKVSFQSLGGPIAIFQTAGMALNEGLTPFLSFLAFLSISIGIINVIPLPGLDGGHLLFQGIEAIIRRPIPVKVLALCYQLGFILLLILVFQSVINDVARLY